MKEWKKYKRLIESLENEYFFYSHNLAGEYLYISPSVETVLGYTVEESYGGLVKHMTKSALNDETIKTLNKSASGVKQKTFELELYTKDRDKKVIEITESPLFDENGELISIEGVAHDITARKKQEELIKKQNIVNLHLEIKKKNTVYSWAAKNVINGLIYGNGGIKLWNKALLKDIKCHQGGDQTDWCHLVPYYQMNNWYSYNFCNASPFQAFRAGFREAIKLCLDKNGNKTPDLLKTTSTLYPENKRRLLQWMTVGLDVTNGIYAIIGSRLACMQIICDESFDTQKINNYEWFKDYWEGEMSFLKNGHYHDFYQELCTNINFHTDLEISNFNSEQSRVIKSLTPSAKREGTMTEIKRTERFINDYDKEKQI